MSRLTIFRTIAVMLGAALASLAGTAHAATCGIETISGSAQPAVYDPFNPSGLVATTVTVTLRRVNTSGGGDTRVVNFFLRANPSAGASLDGSSLVPQSVVGNNVAATGLGLNIFYNYNAAPPVYAPTSVVPSGANRFLSINFTGNNAGSDTATVTFQVTLPANLNLNAVQNLSFDAFYSCKIQGGQDNNLEQIGSASNAVVFPVTVLSALRTYYAGTALDFGEIGNITTASLTGTPQKTNPGNYVFVQSSAAYSVTLSSQNGFKLFKPGATVINDKINYQLRFLGMDVNSGTANSGPTQTAITRTCQRAGLTTVGNVLPIQATLLEGGQGKNPSPSYADILTVTVTPLAYNTGGGDLCASYGL